jgi:hypothetical protein
MGANSKSLQKSGFSVHLFGFLRKIFFNKKNQKITNKINDLKNSRKINNLRKVKT